jgi:hypothetical protein
MMLAVVMVVLCAESCGSVGGRAVREREWKAQRAELCCTAMCRANPLRAWVLPVVGGGQATRLIVVDEKENFAFRMSLGDHDL